MKDFIHAFLFGDSDFKTHQDRVSATIAMDSGKEGWLDIPHGGIGMGALLELAAAVDSSPRGTGGISYPLCCSFRMGGKAARVGDRVRLEAAAGHGKITGAITVEGEQSPYISADIGFGGSGCLADGYVRDYVPSAFDAMSGSMAYLPNYKNCFVCGMDRKQPGLKRRFYLWQSPCGPVACAFAGFNPEDRRSFFRFERGGVLHPMPLLALLDETMGWGAFFISKNGGVSVRLIYRIFRKISIREKLMFLGRGEKVSGRIDKRMFFWASGAVCVVHSNGSLETVAEAWGQWYAIADLTEEMRRELLPKELTEAAFAAAEGPLLK
jgi:hypothetical protein